VIGFLLLSDWSRRNEAVSLAAAGACGIAMLALGVWLDARPLQLYAVHDFWHTSPNFFLARTGVLLATLVLAYLWCRWGAGERRFSPLIELGKSSLLVYWVHMQFVYGGLSILHKRSQTIATATLGLAAIFIAMTLLAAARNRFPAKKAQILAFFRGAAGS